MWVCKYFPKTSAKKKYICSFVLFGSFIVLGSLIRKNGGDFRKPAFLRFHNYNPIWNLDLASNPDWSHCSLQLCDGLRRDPHLQFHQIWPVRLFQCEWWWFPSMEWSRCVDIIRGSISANWAYIFLLQYQQQHILFGRWYETRDQCHTRWRFAP